MTSTIKLYAGVQATMDKNMAIDDIDSYLSGFDFENVMTFLKQNYVKHGLEIVIKLPLGQASLARDAKNFNYCVVQNIDDNNVAEPKFYYFIKNKKWISKETIGLELFMDSVNTIGTGLNLTNKTLIHRQHKDRFYTSSGYAYGIIDKTAENLQPMLYKFSEQDVKSNNLIDRMKWYLAYMTENDPEPAEYNQINPVHNYIFTEKKTPFHMSGGFLGTADFEEGYWYTISPNDKIANNTNGVGSIKLTYNGVSTSYDIIKELPNLGDPDGAYWAYRIMALTRSGSVGTYKYYRVIANSIGTQISATLLNTGNWTTIEFGGTMPGLIAYYKNSSLSVSTLLSDIPNGYLTQIDSRDIAGLNAVDRTDPKLIKIVELPYCPLPAGGVENNRVWFNIPILQKNLWNGNLIEPQGFTDSLEREISTIDNPFRAEWQRLKRSLSTASNWHRSKLFDSTPLEPKLYSSEVYGKKFVYDSFVYNFDFEEVDVEATADTTYSPFKFKFITSLAITSKFAFDFSDYWKIDTAKSDYPSILLCARNNEISIYNNQYLNYLRTGLQYDLKNKERQERQSVISTALTTAGAVSGMALGIASMNPAIAVPSIISGASAITNSVVAGVSQSIASTQAIEQKKEQLRNQSTAVQTSDDLPLMRYYTKGNIGKICTYRPSESMRDNLLKLFHYSGYKCEYTGVPSINSRVRFNYVNADIDIKDTDSAFLERNYSEEVILDYKARWQTGLFIIHHYDNTWDFDLKYENWETILESYLN